MDYKKIGLKVGLEVHQQIETKYKLFCKSSAELKEKQPILTLNRKQSPVASELGEIDIATEYEAMRDRVFYYHAFKNETCLVETDCEPPHEMNLEALQTAMQIALMLNCEIPDEIHVMRKTITDGSNPTAFQRTAIVGMNGSLNYKGRKVPISYMSLEEDASAIAGEEEGKVYYRLNRTGIPLVEISTGILEGFSPEEIQDIAFQIGMVCRSTGKVKRGIGTIRQDINISIGGGARTELKGFQELGLIAKTIENEISRQSSIRSVRIELNKKGLKEIKTKPVDVTEKLRNTQNLVLKTILGGGGKIFAILLPDMSGYLKKEILPGKTFGRELADVAVAFGVKGIMHTDEDLNKTHLSSEIKILREVLKGGDEDVIVIIGETGSQPKVSNQIINRMNQILAGIKQEVRGVQEDGTTKYNRPLSGAARMYPETDVIPLPVPKDMTSKIKKNLPESWIEKLEKFKRNLKLSDDLAKQIIRSDYLQLFEKIIRSRKVEPSVVANVFTSTLKDLQKRADLNLDNLQDRHFEEIFELVEKKKIIKEAIPEVLKEITKSPNKKVSHVVVELEMVLLSDTEIEKIAKQTVQKGMPHEKAVGLVMSKVRGKADPKTVMKIVKKVME